MRGFASPGKHQTVSTSTHAYTHIHTYMCTCTHTCTRGRGMLLISADSPSVIPSGGSEICGHVDFFYLSLVSGVGMEGTDGDKSFLNLIIQACKLQLGMCSIKFKTPPLVAMVPKTPSSSTQPPKSRQVFISV